jgi:hypothetical protein
MSITKRADSATAEGVRRATEQSAASGPLPGAGYLAQQPLLGPFGTNRPADRQPRWHIASWRACGPVSATSLCAHARQHTQQKSPTNSLLNPSSVRRSAVAPLGNVEGGSDLQAASS